LGADIGYDAARRQGMADRLKDWLERLDLGRYADIFAENEVGLRDLPHITEDDLKTIGLPLGPRRRLLASIEELDSADWAGEPDTSEEGDSPQALATGSAVERRQITVLFSDLVGSTALSARLDPEDMRDVIRAYQDACAGVIARFDGFIGKFMGDGVLTYFGYPRAHEDEAELAVRAGLSLIEAVARQSSPTGERLAARVGIATGLVVVGDLIGQNAAQEQTVVGDAPNLAARLQEIAGPGQVVVAETTRRLLGAGFIVDELGQHALKGLSERVNVYAVSGERAIETRFEARAGALQPIVGRDQELALLQERWSLIKDGEAQGVLLVGEAGIGKSRIVRGLLDALGDEPHTRIQYQCSPYQTDSALAPVIQQLQRAAGFAPEDTRDSLLDKLEAMLAPTANLQSDTALIAELLGLEGSERYGRLDLTPTLKRAGTLEALSNQLLALARAKPVLVVLEDAHWIDPTTLELIEQCLDAIVGAPVLILMTSRPDNQPEIAAHPHVTRLTLNRLARAGVEAIVARLGGESLPRELIDTIIAHTDGVPLFVEELTKAVLETGETSIPSSLHDSLMARLDRIPDVKEIAQMAACIGREFEYALLAAIVDLSERELTSALGQLASAELIFRRGAALSGNYLFKHALVRDAAYESLLKSRREQIHGQIGDALERRGNAAPEILARHSEYAGRLDAAVDHWRRAGKLAIAQPAYKEAISNFGAAIRLCKTFGDDVAWQRSELEIQVELGQALLANLGYQAAETLAAFERAVTLAEAIGEPNLLVPSIFGLWASHYISNRSTGNLADRVEKITAKSGSKGHRCVNMRMLALEHFHAGEYRKCLELVDTALAIYDPNRHRDLALTFAHDPRSAATNYKAWSKWHLGFADQARVAAEDSISWAREIDHPNTIGIALCYGVSLTNIWRRDLARVEEAATEVVKVSEEKSLELWDTWGRIYLAWVRLQRGDRNALKDMEGGIETAHRIGAVRFGSFHLGLLAEAQSRFGQHDVAKATLKAAFDLQGNTKDAPLEADLYRLRAAARLRASSDSKAEATADLGRALEIARRQGALSLELRAARDLARLSADDGKIDEARQVLFPVYARFIEGFDTSDLTEAKVLIDELS
jgi:class 3 adenylate cyclase/tetratricopeptide (TPR) repeat protein